MPILCFAALFAVLFSCRVLGLPACDPPAVNLPGQTKLVFAVVGDWGRVGAIDSLYNDKTIEICAQTGQCCSGLQRPDFESSFDYTDVLDGPQQRSAAQLLNTVCGKYKEGCAFISGVGDNFYPCGADPADSGLNRFDSDWKAIYQQPDTAPHIASKQWLQCLGNHDYGFNFSADLQVAYSKSDSNWVMPSPYFAKSYTAADVSVNLMFLDETPFIGNYVYPKHSKKYFTNALAEKVTPAYINSDAAEYLNETSKLCLIPPANASFIDNISENATGQVPWLKSCLESSKATWDIVVGHYALYGSDVNWAEHSSQSAFPGNCGAFGSLVNLLEEYTVAAYLNGHDHTSTHADPKKAGFMTGDTDTFGNRTYWVAKEDNATQYFTLGNGGSVQWGDGVTLNYPKDYNNFDSVVYNDNTQYGNTTVSDMGMNAAVGEGLAIVSADSCSLKVEFYNVITGADTPVHTAIIHQC